MLDLRELKQVVSIEDFPGLNGLDVGSRKYRRYVEIMHDLANNKDVKKMKIAQDAIKQLGIIPGIAITLNPSSTPPLDFELKYAKKKRLSVQQCEDGYYRWFFLKR